MLNIASGRARSLLALGTAAGVALSLAPTLATANGPEQTGAPKNIILFISDGAGYNQFDIASLYEQGQSRYQVTVDPATGAVERAGGPATQVYEDWDVQVAQSHYSASGRASYVPDEAWGDFGWVKEGPTDSAAAGTALGTGVKTINGTLGFDPEGNRLLTLGEQALAVDKGVGLVTSVPFNHATPAGFIAHNPDRNDYHGLATEMIDSGVDVMIGAGHPNYTDANTPRSSDFGEGSWISQADFDRVSGGGTDYTYIDSRAQFEQVAAGEDVPDKLFGLARVAETFQYNRPGLDNDTVLPFTDPANADVPSLVTSTDAALNVLERKDEGFFLMVEGGAVDWAGHANQTTRVIEEQLDFNASVEAATEWVQEHSSWDETLIMVTADHETGFLAGDGAGDDTGWTPMTGTAGALPNVSWHSPNHTNALVPLFAHGAGADRLQARATEWDPVRGAYLDNTDVGEVVFDLLGHAHGTGEDSIGVGASVGVPSGGPGALELSVDASGTSTFLSGDSGVLTGALPTVNVADTRSDSQAQGRGWAVAGSAREFVAGNRSFGADALSWTPQVVSSENGARAGGPATLQAPATLADATQATRLGRTVVGAELALAVPADARSGEYGSEINLSLFAKD